MAEPEEGHEAAEGATPKKSGFLSKLKGDKKMQVIVAVLTLVGVVIAYLAYRKMSANNAATTAADTTEPAATTDTGSTAPYSPGGGGYSSGGGSSTPGSTTTTTTTTNNYYGGSGTATTTAPTATTAPAASVPATTAPKAKSPAPQTATGGNSEAIAKALTSNANHSKALITHPIKPAQVTSTPNVTGTPTVHVRTTAAQAKALAAAGYRGGPIA
jgi:hypothetical protein